MGTLIGAKVCLGALVRARVRVRVYFLGASGLIGCKRFALVWLCARCETSSWVGGRCTCVCLGLIGRE